MEMIGFLAIGNNEPCPFCGKILDSRPEMKGEDIQEHLFKFHKKEVVDKLFPKKEGKQGWKKKSGWKPSQNRKRRTQDSRNICLVDGVSFYQGRNSKEKELKLALPKAEECQYCNKNKATIRICDECDSREHLESLSPEVGK